MKKHKTGGAVVSFFDETIRERIPDGSGWYLGARVKTKLRGRKTSGRRLK